MPPLPPGYHFTISFCQTLCDAARVQAIQNDLVEVARAIISHYDLRTPSGELVTTRLSLNRTMPLLDEQLPVSEDGFTSESDPTARFNTTEEVRD